MKSKAFTLIELLVVISIIGVLSSIVLVSFSGSRDKARLAKSQNFDAQVSHALGAYAVGIWRFEEGSGITLHDESGCGNDGTFSGNPSPTFPDSEIYPGTKALEFDGSNDYVYCGSKTSLNNLEKFTLTAWIFMDERKYVPTIINKGPETSAQHIWWGIRNNNRIFFELGDSGSYSAACSSKAIS